MIAAVERHHLPRAVVQIGQASLNDLPCRREALTALQRRGGLVLDLEWEQIAVVEVERR
jgi:type II secretory pathway predicted ATPase ExeA